MQCQLSLCGGGLWTKNEACSSLPLVGLVWGVVFCLASVFGMLDDVPSSCMLFCV